MRYIILFILLSILTLKLQAQPISILNKGFTSWLPAPKPDDAMLIGNGEMGAMVYGHPHNELIIVNHYQLYLPTTYPLKPIQQAPFLDTIRQLLLAGNGTDAAKIPVEQSQREGYPGQIWNDPYIPAFDINLKTSPENIDSYKRYVNFETAEAVVEWQQSGNKMVRRQFVSRADSILVIEFTAEKPADMEVLFAQRPVNWNEWGYINSNVKFTNIKAETDKLTYSSEFVRQWEPNVIGYTGVGVIRSTNGSVATQGNTLKISKATNVLLLVKVAPYHFGQSPKAVQTEQTLRNLPNTYQALLKAQLNVHKAIYNRVSLTLNSDTTDFKLDAEVMMQQAKQRQSNAFVVKQFNAARYNILNASGKNVPNLQGIWGFSWMPPWSSDYTHDGNVNVAISSFLSSNMPELMLAYFDYHDARLPYYRENAKNLYGCRGIQVPSHTSSHGYNVHFDPTWCMTFLNSATPWAAHFYYDYWLYTGDKKFLTERAYPFMKETALFFEDFLTLGTDGKYVFNPSYSPENNPKNNPSQACLNATMDVALVKELLRNVIAAGKVVGENKAQLQTWDNMLKKMPAYEVDSNGVFREWLWPGLIENHEHRHISQLYPMYDVIDPEIAANPVLWEGVKKAVYERMKVRRNDNGGIMVFGLVQMAWVAANLGDADMVQEIIDWLSSQYWSNSLATYHDPNGLFNMDLSGGFQTVVIKALVYSEPGYLHIFPAKPPRWESGSIKGIMARNQVEIRHLNWNKNSCNVSIVSPLAQQITLKLPKDTTNITLTSKTGKLIKFDAKTRTAVIQLEPLQPLNFTITNN